MKKSAKCSKCDGNKFAKMNFRPDVALEFGTYYLGDSVLPKLKVCLSCGFSEIWIDGEKDLEDIRKFTEARQNQAEASQNLF